MIEKITDFFLDEEEESSLLLILGPLFLLCSVVLAARSYDLLAIAIIGLFLCAKWHVRGCVYALLMLGLAAIGKHWTAPQHHLWQLGIESSIGFSFLISALAFEQTTHFEGSLQQQIETSQETIRNLEEDLVRHQEERAAEQIAKVEKIAQITQQYEEAQADLSSLHVLNEVLRKTTAKAMEEKDCLAGETLDRERKIGQLLQEIDALQKELHRLNDESSLIAQNGQLFKELNEARAKEAQTHLVNETLARLHAKESQRAKELFLQTEQLAEHLYQNKREAEMAAEQLRLAEMRLPSQAEQIIEPLYRQLKAQFEEKNNILHQTRVKLFQTDTELQTLKQTIASQELIEDSMPPALRTEVEAIEKENTALSEENRLLQDLVSHLMEEEVLKI